MAATDRRVQWRMIGEDWAIASSERLVPGSSVTVTSRDEEKTIVEVLYELEEESDQWWYVYAVRRQ